MSNNAMCSIILLLCLASSRTATALLREGGGSDGGGDDNLLPLSLGDDQRGALRNDLEGADDLGDANSCQECRRDGVSLGSSSSARDDAEEQSLLLLPTDLTSLSHLLPHAWSSADYLTRKDDGQLVKMSDIKNSGKYQHPRPFLICDGNDDDDREDIVSTLVSRGMDRSLLYIPPESEDDDDDDDCVVLTTTAAWARRARGGFHQEDSITIQPLLDVMKISPGTLESVTSPAWRVPPSGAGDVEGNNNSTNFIFVQNQHDQDHHQQQQQHWERRLSVNLVPGLEIQTEDDMMDLVDNVMQDLQEMAEVGWVMRQNVVHAPAADDHHHHQYDIKAWRQRYLVDRDLVGVPPLHEMFSLTATRDSAFARRWDDTLANGLESYHFCTSLYRTLYVATGMYPSYNAFDLILNPVDGPPPQDVDSSANNADCVSGLIAALSVHPYVLGVEANVPEHQGWTHAATSGTISRL